ncbi:hypothetical protein BD289DRAFT_273304 [Coniella lustricola]|uniref:Uncharacterized protein n=1 Tax=Coniella lustricola TaxID=2025994 RepID=A0A2T3A6U4_9PEZI|nr:hypothetical protein BD289DRAFT_273304 [Coniella lustricola]
MVRLFGLKLGSDKKKKAAEAQAQAQQYRRLNPQASEHNLSWRSQRQEALMSSSGRNPGSETPYGGSVISLLEPGPFTTSNLNPALRSFKSEANLPGLGGLRNANMSSSSLALPPVLFGDDDGRLRSRPGSAQSIHSVRSMGGGWRSASKLSNLKAGNLSSTSLALPPDLAGDGARSPASSGSRPGSSQSNRDPAGAGRRPHLDVKTSNLNPPSPSSGPLPSPLGRYELASPVGSDAESLLGDEPGKVADQIASRIVREEKLAKASGAGPAPQPQPRPRPAQAGIPEVRHPPQMKASETQRKYSGPTRQPSPQARGGDERNMPSFLVPGAHTNRKPDASPTHHTSHSLGRATDVSFRDTSQGHISHDWRQRYGLGDDGASHHGRALNSTEADQARHRGGSNVDSAHRDKSQQRPHPRKPEQGATVPGPTSPRSPLFRQRSPFDDARSDSDQDQDLYSTGRNASHAPYGIPSPPLSHRHQLSDDNTTTNNNDDNSSGTPIYRTVEAKRDTVLVGGPGRESLGLQIEKTVAASTAMPAATTAKSRNAP